MDQVTNVKNKTIYDWVHRDKIPYYKLGALVQFDPNEIERWLKSKKVKRKSWDHPI